MITIEILHQSDLTELRRAPTPATTGASRGEGQAQEMLVDTDHHPADGELGDMILYLMHGHKPLTRHDELLQQPTPGTLPTELARTTRASRPSRLRTTGPRLTRRRRPR